MLINKSQLSIDSYREVLLEQSEDHHKCIKDNGYFIFKIRQTEIENVHNFERQLRNIIINIFQK